MTKANTKNMFCSTFSGYTLLHLFCNIAINCFVKSICFVSLLPRRFVCGTRFRMYGFHIFISFFSFLANEGL